VYIQVLISYFTCSCGLTQLQTVPPRLGRLPTARQAFFTKAAPKMLNQKTIEIIKAITPAVAPHAEAITCKFYQRMFAGNPEVKAYFNQAHQQSGQQPAALAGAVCAYFSNIDNLAALGPDVELIAHKHCSLGVRPEHYPIVGKHLMAAIKDVLGDSITEDIESAVGQAYGALADICIGREGQIYSQLGSQPGGWNGRRSFVVDRKEKESQIVTSFYLKPTDAQALPEYLPGQYITLHIEHPQTPTSPRNYSLSDRPGLDYFRISIKREPASRADAPDGLISNYMHDAVQIGDSVDVGPPCGDFTIDPKNLPSRPIVFIAGGIGVTALLAMAKAIVAAKANAPIYFIQAARNSLVHAFKGELRQLSEGVSKVITQVVYDDPLPDDLPLGYCDRVGFVTRDSLQDLAIPSDADYYFCGPKPFMASVDAVLSQSGVSPGRRHCEFFGPKQSLQQS
jgi:nitric oxide dioxygenase